MSSIFLSYSHEDKRFVNKLARDLRMLGFYAWTDDAEIKIGDSLIQKIREGIDKVAYVGAVVSKNSIKSEWVRKELDIAMNLEIEGKEVKVLPLLLDDVELPSFLKGKKISDFRNDLLYKNSLYDIKKRLEFPFINYYVEAYDNLNLINDCMSIDGLWIGKTGKMRLNSSINNMGGLWVTGHYDWAGHLMVGHIKGNLERKVFKFDWNWDKGAEKGNGFFIIKSHTIEGGWFFDFEKVDLETAIKGKSKIIHPWKFGYIPNRSIKG